MNISLLFKAIRKAIIILSKPFYTITAYMVLYLNGVKIMPGLKVAGFLKVYVTRKGLVTIGKNLKLNSGFNHNLIGRQQKVIIWVDGALKIGNNVGMSGTAIICNYEISIGNNVMIGGNTVIYDSDFHSINPIERMDIKLDRLCAIKMKVVIEDNVFIGAHSTILKGVTIGKNSVIGSCSVVTKNIPPNEIWAGNPAKFIKKVYE